jgi:hypothetical protein
MLKEKVMLAQKHGKFHCAKQVNGMLTKYVPKVGQYCVLENFEDLGLVIKAPNSTGDYLIQLEDGTKVRKNLCNRDLEGFLDA